MKKLIAMVLVLVCILALAGCNNAEGNEVMENFAGIITNISDDSTSCLVKVTDDGSSTLSVGDRVIVQIADGSNIEYTVNDYIRVEFNGVVEDVVAVSMADKRIPGVFNIELVDATE